LRLHYDQQIKHRFICWSNKRSFSRVIQHKEKVYEGFTSRYDCGKLVYYEQYQWVHDAIAREKQLKSGPRKKKIDLIVATNPAWDDLSTGWYD
jgi:putative endonuclease